MVLTSSNGISKKNSKNEEGKEGGADARYINIKHVRRCISEFSLGFEIKDYFGDTSTNNP